MYWRIPLSVPGVILSSVILVAGVAGSDIDGDGVDDVADVCSNTPDGILVDDRGQPQGDVDDDCDVDLHEFSYVQLNFAGLDDLTLLRADLTGPLPCVVGGLDNDIELRVVVRSLPERDSDTCLLPVSQTDYLARSCTVVEVYALDASEGSAGISCVTLTSH